MAGLGRAPGLRDLVALAAFVGTCVVIYNVSTAQEPPAGEIVAMRVVPAGPVTYVQQDTCSSLDDEGYCIDPDAVPAAAGDTWAIKARQPTCYQFDIKGTDGKVNQTCVEPDQYQCYRLHDEFNQRKGWCPPGRQDDESAQSTVPGATSPGGTG